MKKIILASREAVLVDDADYKRLSHWRWHLSTKGYACRTGPGDKTILMHRVIAHAPKGMDVDHKNENKLDNRRSNLALIKPADHKMIHIGPLLDSVYRRRGKQAKDERGAPVD